ncbi:hypothetical protein HNQ60_005170 [Povalibacter uvarum]|uniref:Uncharacterized protein n=1 Tax=Povalibacter uvarum TaxID=732238 RepID=A0A841HWG2_9GAMM|nr:hypothetical protein [Povalibacter uvarum]MBB6096248.1 hypothetical protein [Povalibacter uvarum]
MFIPRRPAARLAIAVLVSSLGASVATQAATQCINAGAPAPLEICVQDSGTPGVWINQPNGRTRQYFGDYSWGSSLWLDGVNAGLRYQTGYFSGTALTPVSNTTTGTGTAADPYVITTVADLGASGVRFTQRFTYVNGDRNFRKAWKLENTGGSTFSGLHFFHGGDTYFGGSDSARSWYDASLRMVYVNNSSFSNSGYMGFYANPLTPFSHYFSGQYNTGRTQVNAGQLGDASNSAFLDAGYYLQWDRAELAPGQSWNIEAFETWSPPGSLQVLTPAAEYVTPAITVRKTFKVHNLSDTTPLNVTATASTVSGWTATLVGSGNLSLAPLQVVEVPVDVQVPSNAAAGANEVVQLNVTDGALNSMLGTTRLIVPSVDYSFSSEDLNFGTVASGDDADLPVTLTAGSSSLSIGQVTATAPFSIANDNCSNATIAAGASCTILVRFSPVVEAEYTDTVSVPVTGETLIGHRIDVFGASVDALAVTAAAGVGGTIAPTSIAVPAGERAAFTLSPETGFSIDGASGCGGTLNGNTYTTAAITTACSISAAFKRIQYAVAVNASVGGTVTAAGSDPYHGETASFTIAPQTGYSIQGVTGCDGTLNGSTYTTAAITAACSVSATFTRNEYPVNVTSGAGGNVAAMGSTPRYGDPATFTITPEAGYSIDTVSGCNGTLNGNTYTTEPMTSACSISVTFKQTISDVTVDGKGNGGGGAFDWAMLTGLMLAGLARLRRGAAAVTLGAVATTAAHAADADTSQSGWYVGGSLADASSSESAGDLTRALQDQGYAVTAHIDDDRTAWRIYGGWSLNEYVSFEAAYSDFGDVTTTYDAAIPVLSVDAFLQDAVELHPLSADGFDASIVGRYAIGDRFALRAQVGVLRWDAERNVRTSDGRSAHDDDSGVDLLWGAGLDVKVYRNLEVAASWNHFELDNEYIETLGLAVQYRW